MKQLSLRACLFAFVCVVLQFHAESCLAQSGTGQGIGASGAEDTVGVGSNFPISDVEVEIRGLSSTDARAASLRAAVEKAFGISPGDQFNEILAGQGLARVRSLDGVTDVSYQIVPRSAPPGRILRISVEQKSPTAEPKKAATEFPIIYQDSRSLLRVMLNGGVGAFTDPNPWFGASGTYTRRNPLVQNPDVGADTGSEASWVENYIEYGLGGATQIGNTPFYIYGAGTFVTAMSAGQDIFRDDARATTNVEKLYAGLLYVGPDGGPRINVSAGRQNFTLNDGWLVAQYGSQSNAGPRPGIYLAPRTTHDFAALSTVKWGSWNWTSFYLNPNEFEPLESNTELFGTNLRYNVTKSFYGDVSYLHVPESDTTYATPGGELLPREGLSTIAGHVRWADPNVMDGLWLETEAARQTHADFEMDAWAAYGTVGYLARQLSWTPSISYRYAAFSGDNPGTATYERFDSLYSGGLSEWLQGITINKVLSQPNRETHRIRFNVSPNDSLNLTLDYFLHQALELNNLGGNPALSQLQSRDLGQELQFVARWAISKNLYFVGVASHAIPGEALKLASPEADKPWTSLQAQLYWNF
jgi:hypothetical protein